MSTKFVVGILLIFGGVIALADQGIEYATGHWPLDGMTNGSFSSIPAPFALIAASFTILGGIALLSSAPRSKVGNS